MKAHEHPADHGPKVGQAVSPAIRRLTIPTPKVSQPIRRRPDSSRYKQLSSQDDPNAVDSDPTIHPARTGFQFGVESGWQRAQSILLPTSSTLEQERLAESAYARGLALQPRRRGCTSAVRVLQSESPALRNQRPAYPVAIVDRRRNDPGLGRAQQTFDLANRKQHALCQSAMIPITATSERAARHPDEGAAVFVGIRAFQMIREMAGETACPTSGISFTVPWGSQDLRNMQAGAGSKCS